MVADFDNIDSLYNNSVFKQISSELEKERQDIEELSKILTDLTQSFQKSSKSDITNSIKLKLKHRKLDKNYRDIFFNLINIALNDSQSGSFITLDYNKIYYFADPKQVKILNFSYQEILKSRGATGDFTKKEFENFIIKCSSIVNEIVSVIIIKPDTELKITRVDLMNIDEI